jgi:hypothetical protein
MIRRYREYLRSLPTAEYAILGGLVTFAVLTVIFVAEGDSVGVAIKTDIFAGVGAGVGSAIARPLYLRRRRLR